MEFIFFKIPIIARALSEKKLSPPESLPRLHFSPRLVDVLVSTELDVIVRDVTVIMVSTTILDRPKLFDP